MSKRKNRVEELTVEQREQLEEKRARDEERVVALGHGKPFSRRDFISTGLISGGAWVMAPSVISLLASRAAFGADCPTPRQSAAAVHFAIDCAGGLSMNRFTPGSNSAGELIANQSRQGIGQLNVSTDTFSLGGGVDRRFGIPLAMNSPFYQRFMEILAADANSGKIQFRKFYTDKRPDDTGGYQGSPLTLNPAVGLVGSSVATPVAQGGSQSGLNALSLTDYAGSPAFKPMQVGTAETTGDLFTVNGLANNPQARKAAAKLMSSLSGSQLGNLSRLGFFEELSLLMGCSNQKVKETVENPPTLAWRTGGNGADQVFRDNFPTTALNGGLNAAEITRIGNIAKMIFGGQNIAPLARGGGMIVNGCDVHDNTDNLQTSGERRAAEGAARMAKVAIALNMPLVIDIYSDGSATTSENTVNWTNDSAPSGAHVQILVNMPQINETKRILGQMNSNQRSIGHVKFDTQERLLLATYIPVIAADSNALSVVRSWGILSPEDINLANPFI